MKSLKDRASRTTEAARLGTRSWRIEVDLGITDTDCRKAKISKIPKFIVAIKGGKRASRGTERTTRETENDRGVPRETEERRGTNVNKSDHAPVPQEYIKLRNHVITTEHPSERDLHPPKGTE
jgi:hypothetical protein